MLAASAVVVIVLVALAVPRVAQAATVTIAPGDTLSSIAARSGTSVAALVRANGLADPHVIVAGRTLVLPGPTSTGGASGASGAPLGGGYLVQPGDTLGAIAARHGVSLDALARANGLTSPYLIVAGRSLAIPAPSGTQVAAAQPSGFVAVDRSSVGAMIDSAADRHGVDPALARAVAWQESGWNQAAVSHAGAVGVMQLMPVTAQWLASDVLGRPLDRHSVADNIDGGVAFLSWLQRHAGDTPTAVAAYYQGLDSVRRRGYFDDTEDYVRNVLALRGTK